MEIFRGTLDGISWKLIKKPHLRWSLKRSQNQTWAKILKKKIIISYVLPPNSQQTIISFMKLKAPKCLLGWFLKNLKTGQKTNLLLYTLSIKLKTTTKIKNYISVEHKKIVASLLTPHWCCAFHWKINSASETKEKFTWKIPKILL